MRIFLDANVIFSAAKSDGAVRRLLSLLEDAGHECWVDGYVLEEAQRNLAIKGPDGLAVLETLVRRLQVAALHSGDVKLLAKLPLPEKDRPVLAAAIRLGCTVLVTGDRAHFGALYSTTFENRRAVRRFPDNRGGERSVASPRGARWGAGRRERQRAVSLLYGKTLHGVTVHSPRSAAQALLATR